jgi:hypothetical protein
MLDSSQIRHFLLETRSLVLAIVALLVAVERLVRIILRIGKELNKMGPAMRWLEVLKKLVKERSLIISLLLGLMLVALGSGVLAGRAAVADTGKSIGNAATFSVDDYFEPTGKMGDIDDVNVDEQPGFVRFMYNATGGGQHKWEWTYKDGKENTEPAQFGGVMYLDPSGNWGKDPDGGYDLRGCHHVIKWEARSADGEVNVQFLMGGDRRDSTTKEKEKFPYPNTIKQKLVTKSLNGQWQSFDYDLSGIPDENFKRVVGGFGWTISWGSNGVKMNNQRTGSERPKKFTIEIRNVHYEK